MSALNEWWQDVSPRERALLGTGGAVAMAALLYVLVFEPLAERRMLLARQYAAERIQAGELRRWAQEAAELRAPVSSVAAIPSASLLASLNTAIAEQGLKTSLKRLVPASDREVEIAFEGVAFDKLLTWIIALHTRYGIEVLRVNVERAGGPGLVSANLSLGRS